MKKNVILFFMAGLMAGAMISCTKDNPAGQAGSLTGDDEEANAAVRDLRLASVGRIYYEYDGKGNLVTITDDSDDYEASAENNFKMTLRDVYKNEVEETVISFEFRNNRIHSISSKLNFKYEDGTESGEGSASFKYNGKGQISSISCSYKLSGKYDDETFSLTEKLSTVVNYDSDNRIASVETLINVTEDGDKETYKEKIEYSYASGRVNPFYQYTPNLASDLIDGLADIVDDRIGFDAFAYAGLFGRASSAIPNRSTSTVESSYNGRENTRTTTLTYTYDLNSDGTISRADGSAYWYTSVGTRGGTPVFERNDASERERRPRHRFAEKRSRRFLPEGYRCERN